MEANYSNRVRDVISYSREEAVRLGHDYIGTEHLLLGLIREGEGLAIKILENLGVDLKKLRKKIEEIVKPNSNAVSIGSQILQKRCCKY
jgi:ATP-dependent Clp protease ATP-binding subunit ClpC